MSFLVEKTLNLSLRDIYTFKFCGSLLPHSYLKRAQYSLENRESNLVAGDVLHSPPHQIPRYILINFSFFTPFHFLFSSFIHSFFFLFLIFSSSILFTQYPNQATIPSSIGVCFRTNHSIFSISPKQGHNFLDPKTNQHYYPTTHNAQPKSPLFSFLFLYAITPPQRSPPATLTL